MNPQIDLANLVYGLDRPAVSFAPLPLKLAAAGGVLHLDEIFVPVSGNIVTAVAK